MFVVLLLTALHAAAAAPWWPVYESAAFVVAVAVAVGAGLAIGIVGAYRAWPGWVVVVALAGAYLVLGVPAAVPTQALFGIVPTPGGLVDLVTGTWMSWKQLVTISVPVGSYQSLLVPPFLLALFSAGASATIALRTRAPAAAILPPGLLLVAGIAFGAVRNDAALPEGFAFLVASAAWLVRVAVARRKELGLDAGGETVVVGTRRVVGAAAILAVAVAGGSLAAAAIPPAPRVVVRSELQPPFEPRDLVSPLAGFRTAFDDPVADAVMLDVTGLPPGTGLRLAALDTYDGIVYTVGGGEATGRSGRFARVPYRLDQSQAVGEGVDLGVRVLGYSDVWVPGVGRLERISFSGPRAAELSEGYVYNDVTGTGAVATGLAEGDAYAAAAVAPSPIADIAGFAPGTSVLPETPALPERLAQRLEEWAPASLDPGPRLAALISGIRTDGYVSHGGEDEAPSRAGHSFDRLTEFVTARPMVGDGEQYAVLAALLAREIGFPARVVVGYLRTPAGDEAAGREPDAAGQTVFRGSDRQAWIEVQTADGGWRQIDPNPEVRPVPEEEPDEPAVVSRPQSAVPPPADRTPVEEAEPEEEIGGDTGDDPADTWLDVLGRGIGWVGLGLLVLGVLASPFAAIVVAKLRRRRIRRRAPSPVDRIDGAWREFADTAIDYGYPVRPSATRAEQAASVGGLGPLAIAAAVDRALFAPEGVEGADEQIWREVEALEEQLAGERRRRDRLRATVSLRSLGGYAGSRRGGRR
ncbi:transglutaminase family protein [Agromyces sp. MMS24-JH15]|uniref:transglutaminase family protein n=1 Tax=Agromyces sp. MMS24-JH15 TaxID=3243765 RepID=UPI0037486A1C